MKFSARQSKQSFTNRPLKGKEGKQDAAPVFSRRFGRNRFKAENFIQSVRFALEGIAYSFRTERNFRIDCLAGILVCLLGLVFQINWIEWAALFLVMGVVFVAESINTAIEYTVDLITQGEFDMRAKVIKDVSAGACLLAALTSVCVGCFIFIPRFWGWFH
jgi:undecaprenol kinase